MILSGYGNDYVITCILSNTTTCTSANCTNENGSEQQRSIDSTIVFITTKVNVYGQG